MKPDYNESLESMSGDEFLLTEENLSPSASASLSTTPETDETPIHKLEEIPNIKGQPSIKAGADTKVLKQLAREDNISRDVAAVRKKMDNVPRSPVDIIRDIVTKGSLTEDYKLFGQNWTLRSLDQSDYIQIFEECDALSSGPSSKMSSLMLMSVVFSLEALNGVTVYNWFNDIKLEEYENNRQAYMIAVRRAIRRYFEVGAPALVEKLYDAVKDLEKKQERALNELKNF